MDPKYKQMTDYLVGLGTTDVPHSGERGFLAHLIGVFRDLEAWGCEQDVCCAGMFHSILDIEDFDDLCTIHVCDWLEQVPHSQHWDYRRNAYRQMAKRLGGIALESYVRVFALEPSAS